MTLLCRVMEVSRSGYYAYLKRGAQAHGFPGRDRLLVAIKALAQRSRFSYGSRRITSHLRQQGYAVGRHAVRRLMRQAGVACRQRRRFRATTHSDARHPVAPNILNRQFNTSAPNQAWVADITAIATQQGWLYLACVLDLFSRRIVGWGMADHMRSELVEQALSMALKRRQPQGPLLHHSDRGAQYTGARYQALLTGQAQVSMSRKGDCWDNAVMERFFGSLKSECVAYQIYATQKEAQADIINYIEMFYNSQRLHTTLGYVSPVQFENQYLSHHVSNLT